MAWMALAAVASRSSTRTCILVVSTSSEAIAQTLHDKCKICTLEALRVLPSLATERDTKTQRPLRQCVRIRNAFAGTANASREPHEPGAHHYSAAPTSSRT